VQSVPSNLLTNISGTAGVVQISGPAPASAALVTPTAMASFTWVYQATTVGWFKFSAWATGQDSLNYNWINSAGVVSNVVTVQAPGQLTASMAVQRLTVSENQDVEIHLTVTNTGGAAIQNIWTTDTGTLELGVNGSAASTIRVAGPFPAAPGFTLASGASNTLTWTYRGTAIPGVISFSGMAVGTDQNTGQAVFSNAPTSVSVSVQANPALMMEIYPQPASLTQGNVFTLLLTVTNTGTAGLTADAVGVTVAAWSRSARPLPST